MSEPVLDPAVIATLRQLSEPGGPDVVEEVFAIFLAETPKRLEDIDAAMEIGNATQVHRLAHSLKGSAGNIGAKAMFEACRALDDEAREGKADRLPSLVAAVRSEFARVKAEIQQQRG